MGAVESSAKYVANVTIAPHFESDFILPTTVIVLDKLTKMTKSANNEFILKYTNNLTLADPSFHVAGPIDIVLGSYEHGVIIKPGLIKLGNELPIIQETELGWLISGGKTCIQSSNYTNVNVAALITNIELEQKLANFFRDEQFNVPNRDEWTEEEIYAENHYKKTHFRDEAGRYVVEIPFKNRMTKPELGNSKRIALAALAQLEKRFSKHPELRKQYSDFLNEYLKMNHMREVSHYHPDAHYLPHHCVFKDSTTTKIRVVFNASQVTSNKKCLNEQMALGPLMQDNLLSILLRWRKHKIVFCADIDSQTHLQRILWREAPHEPIKEYELTTVTYGTANAPFLAIRTLYQLAFDGYENYPKASEIVKNDFYVDDSVSGADSVEEALEIYKQLRQLMSSASFNLRKWSTNSQELLKHIPLSEQETQAHGGAIKTLGVVWSPLTDDFSFNLNLPLNIDLPMTKRKLTSEIATLYDPLGWISPVVVAAKHVLQEVWRQKIEWDSVVTEPLAKQWFKIRSELNILNEIKFPRSINYSPNETIELHGFSDASIIGYACCIYVKNVTQNTVRLLFAKAKVTPVRELNNDENITIPRLELAGALLLAEAMSSVREAMKLGDVGTFLWTDSRIVLDWIHADPKRYKSFIATKIKKINKIVIKENWCHVRSENTDGHILISVNIY